MTTPTATVPGPRAGTVAPARNDAGRPAAQNGNGTQPGAQGPSGLSLIHISEPTRP